MDDNPALFNEVDWKRREEEDEALMRNVLNESQRDGEAEALDLNRPLDIGEKADDAQDYEDMSDDDLPEEEEPAGGNYGDVPGLTDDMGTSHDTDDLFGDGDDGRESSPLGDQDGYQPNGLSPRMQGSGLSFPSLEEPEVDLRELNFPEHQDTSNQDPLIPVTAESVEEFIKQSWPAFERGIVLSYNELLPPKKAHFIPKVPARAPKPLNPTKVSLDLAPDTEKCFRIPGPHVSEKSKWKIDAEAKGLVPIVEDSSEDNSSDDGFDYTPADPNEKIGGVGWTDLEIICADWESKINPPLPEPEVEEPEEEPMDDWEKEFLDQPAKRKRSAYKETDFINAPRYPVPNFDNFERMTAHLAKRVVIDLNDPHLLVDIQEYNPAAKRRRLGPGGDFKRTGNGTLASALQRRFNFSNDEAYDALKENHQSKVRATLGNLSVEHSMPALKLQWPYYRVKLYTKDARSFHRPSLKFNRFVGQQIHFSKPGMRKKKEVKKMSTQEIFKESKDLTLGDHYSTATLLEYSEEHPTVLSNFGMGNRIINYYRRKDGDDTERPVPEDKIGDVTILLPEDRSPFSNFGMVDPGETVRTIHNAMYRAPIFKHEAKSTDFLVIRSSTGVSGTSWYIRNIDNLFSVGQQFPSVEIPGPHSRKVTNAAKNRMKMIAFRKIKHSSAQVLKIGDITAHITDSSDMQNRQKLKEFIHYDKGDKVWRMKPGEIVPEESMIRAMVKPEEVCVIDAMQVGSRHLEDAGYAAQDDDDDGDDATEGQSLEQDLAPWKTSKAFLEASADKAMLQLHGEGDPSGCGLAISMIKTSMKGGYIGAVAGPSMTTAAQVEKFKKQNGGHTYNVKKQQTLYNEAIREIWEKQKANLSDPIEHVENDMEREQVDEDERFGNAVGQTPRSMATPAAFDDNASQFSIGSRQGRVMRITRKVLNMFGQLEEVTEIVKDVRVWREYQKRRHALDADNMNVYEARPTGNADFDRQEAIRIKKELARLERNKERRHAREKQKGTFRASTEREMTAASPSATPAPTIEKSTGTTRKCANCGQTGHIKTNKKYCANCFVQC